MEELMKWIKTTLQLCAENTLDQNMKQRFFLQLKAIYEKFTEKEQDQIVDILLSQLNGTEAIYVYSQINFFMENIRIKEGLYKAILREDLDARYGSMVELQTYRYLEGFYREHRLLRKKNLKSWKEKFEFKYTYSSVRDRNPKRIAIVAEQLLSILHAPTQIIFNFAYILQEKLGYEVLIFMCPCNSEMPEDLWFGPITMNSVDAYRFVPMKRGYRGAVFNGYQIDMSPYCVKEYSLMFDLIQAWNPIFVFSMGTDNPVTDLIAEFTTLVFMSVGLTCPVSEAQILIRLGRMDEDTEKEYLEVLGKEQKQIFLEDKIPVTAEKSDISLKREDFGLPLESFLIAIVGNRLDKEIDQEFVRTMKTLLETHENIAFVIIGDVVELKNYFKDEKYQDKIFYLGYCTDLMATYGMIDLYLNPNRAGGGFSSSMALTAGVPVITLPNCDVAYNVGTEFVVSNDEEMIAEVSKYLQDFEYYNYKKQCAEKISEKNSVEKLELYVKNILDKVLPCIEEETKAC